MIRCWGKGSVSEVLAGGRGWGGVEAELDLQNPRKNARCDDVCLQFWIRRTEAAGSRGLLASRAGNSAKSKVEKQLRKISGCHPLSSTCTHMGEYPPLSTQDYPLPSPAGNCRKHTHDIGGRKKFIRVDLFLI